MATKTITITGINSDVTLNLVPNGGDISVDPNDYVQFNLGAASHIASIASFTDNSTIDIFSNQPASGNQWKGQIKSTATGGTYEDYTVTVNPEGSNNNISFDPRITVNQ